MSYRFTINCNRGTPPRDFASLWRSLSCSSLKGFVQKQLESPAIQGGVGSFSLGSEDVKALFRFSEHDQSSNLPLKEGFAPSRLKVLSSSSAQRTAKAQYVVEIKVTHTLVEDQECNEKLRKKICLNSGQSSEVKTHSNFMIGSQIRDTVSPSNFKDTSAYQQEDWQSQFYTQVEEDGYGNDQESESDSAKKSVRDRSDLDPMRQHVESVRQKHQEEQSAKGQWKTDQTVKQPNNQPGLSSQACEGLGYQLSDSDHEQFWKHHAPQEDDGEQGIATDDEDN